MIRTRLLRLPTALLVLTLVASVIVIGQQQATTPEALMGAAQHQEDVEGRLEAAIATYRKVVDHSKAPRALVASALLQIGRLHEKRGSHEAARTYERIAKDFTDQPTIAVEARRRLAALRAGSGSSDHSGVVARQVWAGRDVDPFGSVSPDGRQYAFVDWSGPTGNLAVRDLATGQIRRLTNATARTEGSAELPEWSPDGERLAYLIHGGEVPGGDHGHRLHVTTAAGAAAKAIFESKASHIDALRWSPDARSLALVVRKQNELNSELVIVAADSGRVLRTHAGVPALLSLGGFSPDGRRLVFSRGPYVAVKSTTPDLAGRQLSAIHLMDVESRQLTDVLTGPGRHFAPTWSPDGREIVFLSDRSGTLAAWAISASTDVSGQEPRLVRSDMASATNLRFSRDGALWYGAMSSTEDIFVCQFDPARLATTSTPVRVSDRFVGSNSGPAWSPDGQLLAFFRGGRGRPHQLVIRSLGTGREQELSATFTNVEAAAIVGPTWMPDGGSLLVRDIDRPASRVTVHRLALDGTRLPPAMEEADPTSHGTVRVSPDGQYLYLTRRNLKPTIRDGSLALIRRDLATGEERPIYESETGGGVGYFGLAISRDGQQVSFSRNAGNDKRELILVPTAGGKARVLLRGSYAMPHPSSGAFTPDGRHVLVVGQVPGAPGNAPWALWAIPTDVGTPRQVALPWRGSGISAASLSPDGKRLAFTGEESAGELWSIRNLLPPAPRNATR